MVLPMGASEAPYSLKPPTLLPKERSFVRMGDRKAVHRDDINHPYKKEIRMKLVKDEAKFDDLQPWFTGEIIEIIKSRLEEEKVEGEKLRKICGDIAFSICTLIDGSSIFEVEGKEYDPVLSFSEEEHTMFFNGGSSYLHEYVFGVLAEYFDDDA